MAGGFIHEIKNHVGTLSLNLQLLAEDFESRRHPASAARSIASPGSTASARSWSISPQRLPPVRPRPGAHTEPTRSTPSFRRMIDFLAPTARQKNIEINWFPAPDLPPVNLDRDLFEQCLLNLMLNAEQAMPDGGTLTLIGPVARARPVCLDVIDTGCGITGRAVAPSCSARSTRPRPTATAWGWRRRGRSSLAHGGTIDVQSEPGRGTKFTIRLPVAVPVALVTGASAGTGRAARLLAPITTSSLRHAARSRLPPWPPSCRMRAAACHVIPADLADPAAPRRASTRRAPRGSTWTSWSTTPASATWAASRRRDLDESCG